MKYRVMCRMYSISFPTDSYDDEWSGILHDNKDDAVAEAMEAREKCGLTIWVEEVEEHVDAKILFSR